VLNPRRSHTAKRIGGGFHQRSTESMPLEARLNADLRGVADSFGHFTGQDRGDQFIAAGMPEHERGTGLELAAARQQDDVLQEFKRAVARAVLVVDVAVDVVGVGQIDQLGAGLKVAIVPTVEP